MLAFLTDNLITVRILISIRKDYKELKKDRTEEIVVKVREKIREKGWAHRRLIDAFPNAFKIKEKLQKMVSRNSSR